MIIARYRHIAWLLGIFTLVACSSGEDIESVFRVRAINLSPDSPVQNVVVGDLAFTADFATGSSFSAGVPGDLPVEIRAFRPADLVGGAPVDDLVLRAAETMTFVRDTDYSVITYGDSADLQLLVVENLSPGLFASGTSRLRFANLASSGTVDVYITDLDTDLASETPIATVGFLGATPILEQPNDTYQVRFTQAGTTDVLYDSGARVLDVSQQILFVLGDTPLAGGAPIRLYQLNDTGAGQIADRNTPALVRVLQLSPDTGPLDVFANDEMLTTPLIQNVSFGDLTAYADFPGDTVDIDLTPTGDTSVLFLEDQEGLALGAEHTYIVTGSGGQLQGTAIFDTARSIANSVRFRAVHGTTLLGNVDFYITLPGTVIDDDTVPFFSNLALGGTTSLLGITPGELEVTLTVPGETTVVLGPRNINLVDGGVYTLALRDSDSGASVQLMLINDQ